MDKLATILLILAGLNWGFVGLFQTDIIASIFGGPASLGSRIIYTIFAICAIWCISLLFRNNNETYVSEAREY
jgi:uncharacterized membrane protein YuzA (DUF378 family)